MTAVLLVCLRGLLDTDQGRRDASAETRFTVFNLLRRCAVDLLRTARVAVITLSAGRQRRSQ